MTAPTPASGTTPPLPVLDTARAAYAALRGQVPPADPAGILRHETRLRAVGAVLDAEPAQAFELALLPSAIVVEGSAGYVRVFLADELTELVQAAAQQREFPATP